MCGLRYQRSCELGGMDEDKVEMKVAAGGGGVATVAVHMTSAF